MAKDIEQCSEAELRRRLKAIEPELKRLDAVVQVLGRRLALTNLLESAGFLIDRGDRPEIMPDDVDLLTARLRESEDPDGMAMAVHRAPLQESDPLLYEGAAPGPRTAANAPSATAAEAGRRRQHRAPKPEVREEQREAPEGPDAQEAKLRKEWEDAVVKSPFLLGDCPERWITPGLIASVWAVCTPERFRLALGGLSREKFKRLSNMIGASHLRDGPMGQALRAEGERRKFFPHHAPWNDPLLQAVRMPRPRFDHDQDDDEEEERRRYPRPGA